MGAQHAQYGREHEIEAVLRPRIEQHEINRRKRIYREARGRVVLMQASVRMRGATVDVPREKQRQEGKRKPERRLPESADIDSQEVRQRKELRPFGQVA